MKTALVAIALAVAAVNAAAGSLTVTVTDRDGKPVPDVVVLVASPAKALAASAVVTATIAQEGLKFMPFLTVVQAGSTLRFINKDNYDHHVRSTPSGPLGGTPPVKTFEYRLDAAVSSADAAPRSADRKPPSGMNSAEVKVDEPGAIGLGCHLHSSMRGQVYVSPTPWFAKTDANGTARIANAPEGGVELSIWHPDQLQDQALQQLQLGAAALAVNAQLNFSPKRRRG